MPQPFVTTEDFLNELVKRTTESVRELFLNDAFVLDFADRLQAVWSGRLKRIPEGLDFVFNANSENPDAFNVVLRDLYTDSPKIEFYERGVEEPVLMQSGLTDLAIQRARELELLNDTVYWVVLVIPGAENGETNV